MKNHIYFAVITFTMCLFWIMIYLFAKQILAAYIAIVFGLIFIVVFSWVLLKALIIAGLQSSVEIDKLQSKSLVKKTSVKVS